jgi:hypothetical protein
VASMKLERWNTATCFPSNRQCWCRVVRKIPELAGRGQIARLEEKTKKFYKNGCRLLNGIAISTCVWENYNRGRRKIKVSRLSCKRELRLTNSEANASQSGATDSGRKSTRHKKNNDEHAVVCKRKFQFFV